MRRLGPVALGTALLTLVAALAVPAPAAGQGGAVPDRPARPVVDAVGHDSVTLSWDDPGDATITGYQILRRNRDVDALGEFTVVEDDTASTDTSYTDHSVDAATRYGYRIKARNAHGLSPRSRAARVETPAEPETEPPLSSESAEAPSVRDGDSAPESPTDTGTETGTDFVEAWTSVLDVGATDGTVGYSRWAQFGSLSPDRFDVDGTTYQVMLLAEFAGGLYLGLRASLDVEFVLEVDGERFVGSQSLVPGGLPLRGTYWWPADGVVSGSVGGAVDVSLSAGTDALAERGASPPGAWFSQVPDAHDGSSQFTLRLNVDESDVGVTAGSMADALTVLGGSLAAVSEVSPAGRTWELTVAPDGIGDVTVSLSAPTDCVSALSVCSADGRMLRNSPQATVQGSGGATRLRSLSVGTLVLSPAFDPEVTLYSATAPAGTQQITVDADTARVSSTAVVSPEDADLGVAGHQVALAQGAQTVIAVTVVAADGAEGTYWAVVDVSGPGPSEQEAEAPKLNGLAVDGVDDLGFDPAITRYETTADADAEAATIITGLHDTDATVQVITVHGDDPALTADNSDSDPDREGHQASLAADGDTLVLVIVTSADGLRQQAYVILISQQASGTTTRYQQPSGKQPQAQTKLAEGLDPGLVRSPVISVRHTNLPTLDSLTLTDTALSPAFAAGTTAYTAEVVSDVATVTVTPSAPEGTTFIVTPADADADTDGHQVALAEPGSGGDPTRTVIAVIARNAQNAVNAYIITVTRDSAISEVLPAGCDLRHLQDQGDGTRTASGRWGPSCRSIFEYHEWVSHLPSGIKVTGYAYFYELTLPRLSDVTIRLHTSTSTHTVLRTADGTLLEHYFDHVDYTNEQCISLYALPCPAHGRLKTTLGAGTYLVEAVQHYSSDRRRRNFTIDVAVSDHVEESAPLLASLSVDGTSVPSFSPETFLYEIDRPGAQVTVAAEAETADPPYEVSISPADADENLTGHQIDVAEHGLTDVIVTVSDDAAGSVHEYKVVMSGDHSADVSSTGAVPVGGSTRARVDSAGDRDWFAVDLVAGTAYVIELLGADSPPGTPASGTLEDPKIWGITLQDGTAVADTSDDDSGYGNNSSVWYRPTASGKHFVIAGAQASGTGIYELAVSEVFDDFAASTSTTGVVTVGGAAAAGEVEIGDDQDWFEVTLAADERYWFLARGASTGNGTLTDPHLYGVMDSTGTLVAGTTDADSGVGTDAFVVFEPATAGSYYVAVGTGNSGRGSYELTAGTDVVTADSDDYPDDTTTTATVAVDGAATSAEVEYRGDRDWLAVTLAANTAYWLEVQGAPSGNGTLADPNLYGVYDAMSALVAGTSDADNGHGYDAELIFEVSTAGTYYIDAGSSEVGTYQVTVTDVSDGFTDDFAGDATTTGTLTVGGKVNGHIQYLGDQDWFAVTLEADQEYFVWVEGRGRGRGTLPDPHLYGIYDSTSTPVTGTEDSDSGAGRDSFALVTVHTDGTYYVAAGSAGGERGTYQVTVIERPTVSTSELDDGPGSGPGDNPGDHAADVGSEAYLALDDSAVGRANVWDRDWYWVYLEAGTRYRFELEWRCEGWWWGCSSGRLPRMLMRDDDGNALVGISADANDDIDTERRFYTPQRTGMHLLEVWSELKTATYTWNFSYTLDLAEANDE